ncbi:MAG: chemotaxis protein CheW [Acidobacteriota bacterium]|nr:chemotaxis protein CheW [Acidobacteriota bacterium]
MEKQFMTFTLGGGTYGINILGIREINYNLSATPVPLAKSHIVGLLNLRGQIVTIFDTGIPLGYQNHEGSKDSSLLIMKTNSELSPVARREGIETHKDQVGLMVDQIGDVISCEEGDIEPVPAHADVNVAKFLEGVVKQGDALVGIINVPELLKYE